MPGGGGGCGPCPVFVSIYTPASLYLTGALAQSGARANPVIDGVTGSLCGTGRNASHSGFSGSGLVRLLCCVVSVYVVY